MKTIIVSVLLLLALGCGTTTADKYPADPGHDVWIISTNAAGVIATNSLHFGP